MGEGKLTTVRESFLGFALLGIQIKQLLSLEVTRGDAVAYRAERRRTGLELILGYDELVLNASNSN